MDKNKQMEIESAVFKKMINHFQERTDVQNIDVMEASGFCRNCLSRWYLESAEALERRYQKKMLRKLSTVCLMMMERKISNLVIFINESLIFFKFFNSFQKK